jgi:hypothetical protein
VAVSRAQLADPECQVSDEDYDVIESAIMETARGRWFLFEYARRHRHADTLMVMSAINSLHDSLQSSLQHTVQAALAPPRRNPYVISTSVTAALPEPRAELRVVEQAVATSEPPAPAAETGPPELAKAGDIFEFKV